MAQELRGGTLGNLPYNPRPDSDNLYRIQPPCEVKPLQTNQHLTQDLILTIPVETMFKMLKIYKMKKHARTNKTRHVTIKFFE